MGKLLPRRIVICPACSNEFRVRSTSTKEYCSLSCSIRDREPWNKGLTKETNASVLSSANKRRNRSLEHKPYIHPFKGKTKYNLKSLANLSESVKAKWCEPEYRDKWISTRVSNILSGRTSFSSNSFSGCKYRVDLHRTFRSSWEANFVRVLNSLEIVWEYESKRCRFKLSNGKIYIVDFYIPDFDLYVEIKGRTTQAFIDKLKTFRADYPIESSKFKILDLESYHYLYLKFCDKIHFWERGKH